MSKESYNYFYNYLAKKVISYFETMKIGSGEKYDIQFDKDEEVEYLYYELKKEATTKEFSYIAKEGEDEYLTYSFSIDNIDIIVAATIDGIQSDYLTNLRNKVGNEKDEKFRNTSILFIHNSSLDSLIKGSISFKKEGMPFHPSEIIKDAKKELKKSKLEEDKISIIEYELEKNDTSNDDGGSLEQFSELLEVINKGKLDKSDYQKFGLFEDESLKTFEDEERKNRIKENADIYRRIEEIHKYETDIDNALDKFLDEKGKKELSDPLKWDSYPFEKVVQSMNNKSDNKIKYEGYELQNIDENNFWDKPKSITKAGERSRRIIIFNPDKQENFEIFFKFDKKVQPGDVKNDKNQEAEGIASGKKIKVKINHEIGKVSFNRIRFNSTENYEFRIVILDIDNTLFKESDIEFGYDINIKEKTIEIDTANSELILNRKSDFGESFVISEQNQKLRIEDKNSRVEIRNELVLDGDTNSVKVNLNIDDLTIPFSIKDEGHKPTRISGFNVWLKKREDRTDFIYVNERLTHKNIPYYATDEFRNNLTREEKILESEGLYFIENKDIFQKEEIDIPDNLRTAYLKMITYYKSKKLLPSLAYYTEELCELAKDYINEFTKAIDSFQGDDYFNSKYIDLANIGTIKLISDENFILMTPLHPLNIIYQLKIQEVIGDEKLSENIARKLNSLYLLPYISEKGTLYKPVEQSHSMEWKYYVENKVTKYKSSRKFISKLVKEKIEEFVGHFPYLFNLSSKSPIRINLINTGNCKEVLQGLINYYIGELKNKINIKELREIHVNIYSNEEQNIFEELAYYETASEVEENLGINLDVSSINKNYTKEDLLSICRDKIMFYRKDDESYEYCHITFYEMSTGKEDKECKMQDMITGVSLNGLISGVPSRYIGGLYRTGFGNKYMDKSEENLLLDVTTKLNSLYKAIEDELAYDSMKCTATLISDSDKHRLNSIYDSSNWVTFIEPKFDLDFFKSNEQNKDLLIIHYSDQYTSSSGYDAITVTRKSKQYSNIIKEFLTEKNINVNDEKVVKVINCFNAINGDWLLRLISDNGQFPREKISLISAVKLSMAYFYHKDIIWVPISLEEILRVSRGAGLNSSDGLFSVKNLKGEGVYSDDLLLIGIEDTKGKLKVHYYPVEVKIGKNDSSTIKKAKKQAYKTRNYLEKHMIDNVNEDEKSKFAKKMYRNFMMQLVMISAEKLKLYDIWTEQNWDLIVDSDVRRRLLNDDYEISNELDSIIGRGSILSFKEGLIFNKIEPIYIEKDELGNEYNEDELKKGNEFLELSFTENIGYNYIIKNIEELKDEIKRGMTDIPSDRILSNRLKREEVVENKEINDIRNSEIINTTSKESVVEQHGLKKDYSVFVGKEVISNEPVIYDPKRDGNPLSNMNVMITGSSGKGKTQLLKSMIVQARKQGINLLVFDFKNDFSDKDFLDMADMQCINLEYSGLPYNPLIPPIKGDENIKFMNVGEHILALSGVFKQVYKLGTQQEASLKNAFRQVYKDCGINPRRNNVGDKELMFPIVDDIADILEEDDEKAYSRLDTLFNYGLFTEEARNVSLVELLNGSYVFNLSSISNDEVKNAIAKIIVVSTHQYMNTLPHSPNDIKNIFVFDEAHRFLGEPSLEKLARECRAYGMAIWLSSQYPGDYPDEIKGCLETKIIHGNGDDEEKIKVIKKLLNYSGDDTNISRLGLFQAIFSNTHYNKKFINTLGFPQMLLLEELRRKGRTEVKDIESISEVRREEVISYLVKLGMIKRENDSVFVIE